MRIPIRVLTTRRGSVFEVIFETAHYVLCNEPNNADRLNDALTDFDSLADQGYFFIYHYIPARSVLFEKRLVDAGIAPMISISGKGEEG